MCVYVSASAEILMCYRSAGVSKLFKESYTVDRNAIFKLHLTIPEVNKIFLNFLIKR